MPRFELHDGPMKKFWEIELQGETLHFSMGDIGTPGRERVKRHRHERAAQEAYEKAVRAMVAQGYEQQLDEDEAEELVGPTWPVLLEEPGNIEALQVHADWLMSHDDPRGDLLALELAAEGRVTPQIEAMRSEHAVAFLGDHEDFPGSVEVTWSMAYGSGLVLQGPTPEAAEAAVKMLRHEGFALLQELSLNLPAAVKVAFSQQSPALRALTLNSAAVGSSEGALDLDRLAVKAPRLRRLKVRGPASVTGSDVITGLLHLDLTEAPGWLEAIVRARPALLTLHISNISVEGLLELRQQGLLETVTDLALAPIWGADLSQMLQNLEGIKLDRLHFRDVRIEVEQARALVNFNGVERLVIDGTLSPEAAALFPEGRLEGRFSIDDGDEEAEPTRPEDLALSRYERKGEKSDRFWAIGIDGAVHHIHYGKLGAPGRWVWTRFPSADVANEMAERRISEKMREGYAPLGADVE